MTVQVVGEADPDHRQLALDALSNGLAVLVVRPGALSGMQPSQFKNRLASIEVVESGYLPAVAEWAIVPKDWEKSGTAWWVEYREQPSEG